MAELEILGHYAIERRADGTLFELGRGAMGITYKAIDTRLHCPVALKVIHNAILDNEVVRQRFLREARSAAGLRHQNVASVFHLSDEGDTYFYAMEYIEGETVEALVRRVGRLDSVPTLHIALQVTSALIAAHRRHLIHRDIKPANLMLVQEEEDEILIKVIDFGLAKSVESSAKTLTAGGFMGTPYFASPEQLEERVLDVRSDIYSLGATLWYMLTGEPIFNGGLLQVMSQHLHRPPPMEQLAGVNDGLRHVLARMLAKDPFDRPQTPLLLRQELAACMPPASAATGVSPLQSGGVSAFDSTGLAALRPSDLQVVSTPELAESNGSETPSGVDAEPPMTGALIRGRYRLDRYCGGTQAEPFFQAADLHSGQEVGLRVLANVPLEDRRWTSLVESVRQLQSKPHPGIRNILSLERFTQYGILVSEWSRGFALSEALAARGALDLRDVLRIVEPLAQTLDHVQEYRLAPLDLRLRRIFVESPAGDTRAQIEALLHQPTSAWEPFALKVSVVLNERILDSATMVGSPDHTMVAEPFSVANAARAERSTSDPVFAIAYVAYQLLGGRSPGTADGGVAAGWRPDKFTVLSEHQNKILQIALSGDTVRFPSAGSFYASFRVDEASAPPRPIAAAAHIAAGDTHGKAKTAAGVTLADRLNATSEVISEANAGGASTGTPRNAPAPIAKASPRKLFTVTAVATAVALLAFGGWIIRLRVTRAGNQKAVQTAALASRSPSDLQSSPGPPSPALGPEQQLSLLMSTGEDFERAGNYAGAIRTYVQAMQRFPAFEAPTLRLNKVLTDFQSQITDAKTFEPLRAAISEAANSGSTLAMMLLGSQLLKTEPTAALRWFQLAADHDRRDAMTQLGKMYWSGQGISGGRDVVQSAAWLEKASERGDAEAKCLLAQLYKEGDGVKQNLPRAVDLLREATSLRNTAAINMLGEFYRDGTGVPTSYKQAADYFEQARLAGSADASANLGVLYINGQGIEKNPRYGMELIRHGAEQNSPLAMYYYAVCFEKGIAQPNSAPNLDQAKIWYVKAARAGDEKAATWCVKNNAAY